jgi:predicted GNAT family N-acyltransferase
MSFVIKQPDTREDFKRYYRLRWQILRAPWNQPEGSEVDNIEEQCFHLMAIDANDKTTVTGVARLQYNSDTVAQIRYMAVAAEHEKQGIGLALIQALEKQARKANRQFLILHARENAVGFYKKAGYRLKDKSYLLFNEIQHYLMKKEL